jgi:protein SCO1
MFPNANYRRCYLCSMSRKRLLYLGFFVVLVIGFYFSMSAIIPGYNKKRIPPISYIKPFSFTNQDGRMVTEKDIQGKVVVVNFFFTTCRSVCPRMNNNLRPVYDAFRNKNDFIILSHTCDPERDNPAKLKSYADSMKVDTKEWIFLTGSKDSLYRAARQSYKIDDPNNNVGDINDDFLHTQFLALVNREGEVVRIYDGLKPSEMRNLKKDISELLKE